MAKWTAWEQCLLFIRHDEPIQRFQSQLVGSLEAIKEALDNSQEGFDRENVEKPGGFPQRLSQS